MIKIQKKDFNLENEINLINSKYPNIGAVSTFVGLVRNTNNNQTVNSLDIEVYKDMAYKTLESISNKAKKKWNLIDLLIIHRFGNLKIGEKIVLVAAFSLHRKDSFEASNFIMDYLKKDAPFWKKEYYDNKKNKYEWIKNSKLKN
tara:strand:- start:7842 stop:8276 length:435 start_codon:yes stop_codon:yes gene_type:complete